MNVIFGGGGVAREVAWILNDADPSFIAHRYVVRDNDWVEGKTIDGVCVISDALFTTTISGPVSAYLAVGRPNVRHRLHAHLLQHQLIEFPRLVHQSVHYDHRPGKTLIGRGTIVYPKASMTTGVSLGDFVQVNPCATLGHGVSIGSYTTICPGANISGEAVVGSGCFIGAGAVIKEGVRIGDNCVIGAGAVVISDIGGSGTWVGVPARKTSS